MRRTLLAAGLGAASAALIVAAGSSPVLAAIGSTQTCPIPVVALDPDSVSISTVTFPEMGPPTVTMTAAETPEEQGLKAPTVRLAAFRADGSNEVVDILHGLLGPSSSGAVSFAAPGAGAGVATQKITFAQPGTYSLGFFVTFDGGVHPCTSLLPTNHSFTVVVPTR